ncbi:MAG: EamA family transporter [Burkholderiales bacterium PBB6]|nr:MAG: EamA family transporter [Burkholderiales bacterium PBB6]
MTAQPRGSNMQGIAWMVLAMAAFAVEDALIKFAARTLPVGEVLMVFGAGGALVFAASGWRSAKPLFHPDVWTRTMGVRAGFELTGRLFYGLAIALTPLSSATAILQATPVLVVLGAKVYFGEQVGWRRWCAVVVGLAGVLIVLRPASSDFSWLSLLTVIGLIGFAGRDLASRAVPATLDVRHLGFYGFSTACVAGALYAVWDSRPFVMPGAAQAQVLVAAFLVGAGAYTALMKAMRAGDIAAVTPFRYTRLLFGVGMGAVAFGERVDSRMLLGCGVILLAGLLIVWDGWRRRR